MKLTINNIEQEYELIPMNENNDLTNQMFYQGNWYRPVVKLKPVKIFTTHDNVDIFEGDEYFFMSIKCIYKKIATEASGKIINCKYFSTKKAAEQYLESLKPKEWSIGTYLVIVKDGYLGINNCLINEPKLPIGHIGIINDDKGYFLISIENSPFYFKKDLAKWFATKEEAEEFAKTLKPKFTFGGHEVTFDYSKNDTIIKISCKETVGNQFELKRILDNYNRPCVFGNMKVKSYTLNKGIIEGNKIQTLTEGSDIDLVDEITIGCITGKYKELVNIHNHCLELLK